MSIKNDIDEIIKEWKTSSKWFKIVVIVSAFITLSAVASLSDTVFAWKGFILDGIEFYNAWIVEPIKKMFSFFNLKFSTKSTNVLIIIVTIITSITRFILLRFKKLKKHTKLIAITSFLLFSIYTIVAYIYLLNIMESDVDFFITLPLFLIFFHFIFKYKNNKKYLIVLIGPILFSIITILILAAINAGLTR